MARGRSRASQAPAVVWLCRGDAAAHAFRAKTLHGPNSVLVADRELAHCAIRDTGARIDAAFIGLSRSWDGLSQ